MKDAYDIRSAYFHGSLPGKKKKKKKTQEELTVLHQALANYARTACFVWPQLTARHKREEVLATLEDALIDDTALARLRQWCMTVELPRRSA